MGSTSSANFSYLTRKERDELIAAFVETGIDYNATTRAQMLDGVDRWYVANRLPSEPGAYQDQVDADLRRMNQIPKLTNGSIPLAQWLENGTRVFGSFEQVTRFEKSLKRVNQSPDTIGLKLDPKLSINLCLLAIWYTIVVGIIVTLTPDSVDLIILAVSLLIGVLSVLPAKLQNLVIPSLHSGLATAALITMGIGALLNLYLLINVTSRTPSPHSAEASPTATPTTSLPTPSVPISPTKIVAATVTSLPTPPIWAQTTPTQQPSHTITIVYAASGGCIEPSELQNRLQTALQEVKQQAEFMAVADQGDQGVQRAREAKALAFITAVCEGDMLSISIAHVGPALYPVSLLPEPAKLHLRATPDQALLFVESSLLYMLGYYDQALERLRPVNTTFSVGEAVAGQEYFYWLRGMILLRQEDWGEAINMYGRGIESAQKSKKVNAEVDLLANRSFARMSAALSITDRQSEEAGQAFTECEEGARNDVEDALKHAEDRPDLRVLSGVLILHCRHTWEDELPGAEAKVGEALGLAPDFAPAFALQAEIDYLRDNFEAAHDNACAAQRHDPEKHLPEPFLILGLMAAQIPGQEQYADAQFAAYTQRVYFQWQINKAIRDWRIAKQQPSEPMPSRALELCQ